MTSDKRVLPLKEILGALFSVVLGVLFLYIAFRGISLNSFITTIKQASLSWIVIYALSTILAHWLRAWRWKVILRRVKPDLSVHHAFGAVMIGYGINNVIPRLGEVSRALFLGQYEGISRLSVLGSIVVERILDTIFFGLAVIISGLIYSGDIYLDFPWLKTTFWIGLIIMIAMIIALFIILLKKDTILCSNCFMIAEENPCDICKNSGRDHSVVCIVEQPLDVIALEKGGKYKGIYHVLHGKIDPLNNIGPDEIFISQLLSRIKNPQNKIQELILATNPTMEGEATAMYIAKQVKLQNPKLTITRIGRGLPIGADLEYADEVTLQRAMEGRSDY